MYHNTQKLLLGGPLLPCVDSTPPLAEGVTHTCKEMQRHSSFQASAHIPHLPAKVVKRWPSVCQVLPSLGAALLRKKNPPKWETGQPHDSQAKSICPKQSP
jgi:hypothetical protein